MSVLYQYNKSHRNFVFYLINSPGLTAELHKRAWHDLHFGLNIDIGE